MVLTKVLMLAKVPKPLMLRLAVTVARSSMVTVMSVGNGDIELLTVEAE